MKQCIKCQAVKLYSEFHKWSQRKDGYRTVCKSCRKIEGKLYHQKYRHKRLQKAKIWRERTGYNKKYYQQNPQYFEKYRKDNHDHYKQWRIKNRTHLANYRTERKKRDPEFKILCSLRSRASTLIRRSKGKKCDSTVSLLGCSVSDFKRHLESKFVKNMSWDNYGQGWHIDHIKPCDAFDLTQESEQRKCFHYTNLQPLWAIDNLRKSCRTSISS